MSRNEHPVHIIVITHTPERLRRTLLGVACQTRPPASLTLACDTDDPRIEQVARDASAEFGIDLTLVLRAHDGNIRMSQTRNNAARALLDAHPDENSWLIFLDGDCVPEPHLVEKHAALAEPRRLVIGWRFDLTQEQDDAFDEDALRDARYPIDPTHDQLDAIDRRHRRYRRTAVLKRFGMTKQHKPKPLGAQISVSLADFAAINGFDESFVGWAQEDDDLARRLYLSGCRPVVAVRDILCFHQWHKTNAPGDWQKSANVHRLREPCDVRCILGLDNPADQPPVSVIKIGADEPAPNAR